MRKSRVGLEITGAFITSHARERVLSQGHDHALRFLTESLESMTLDQAMTVLSGEKRLTGSSATGGLLMEDEGAETSQAVHDSQIAMWGSWVEATAGKWFRPYAFVSGYSPQDAQFQPRAAFYYDNDNDRSMPAVVGGASVAVLFSSAGPPPLWLNFKRPGDHERWQVAVDAAPRLEERSGCGEHLWRGRHFGAPIDNLPWERPDRSPDVGRSLDAQLLAGLPPDIDIAAAAGTLARIRGEVAHSTTPKDPEGVDNGYIDREGRFYQCEYHNHGPLAESLLVGGSPGATDWEIAADDAGFIRLSKSPLHTLATAQICQRPALRQLEAFEEWSSLHGSPELEEIVAPA